MSIDTSIISAVLHGDWTRPGLVKQLSSLSELSIRCKDTGVGEVHIDCSGIDHIDKNGFQVLHLWLRSLHSRGFQPKITKLSSAIRELQEYYGLQPVFE